MANTLPTLKEQTIIDIDFYGYPLKCRKINIADYDIAAQIVEGAVTVLEPNLFWIAHLMVDYKDESGEELTKEAKVQWLKKVETGDDDPLAVVNKTNEILQKLGLPDPKELEDEVKKKSQAEGSGSSGE